MKQETLIDAVRRVRCPAGAWFSAFPKIQGHTEIRIRYRTPDGDEGQEDVMVVHSQISEAEALDVCRDLWLKAAAVLFDVRNRKFGDDIRAARPIFAHLSEPGGVKVDIG